MTSGLKMFSSQVPDFSFASRRHPYYNLRMSLFVQGLYRKIQQIGTDGY